MSHAIEADTLWIEINVTLQELWLKRGEEILLHAPVSTATNGVGEQSGSEQTPRGWHEIRAKIGGDQPESSVFIGRRPTGEICTPELYQAQPERDWVLSRILWLSGLEVGKNRLGKVDTMRRYIYLHGTPDSVELGKPGSHGCVRMRNADIVELFDRIETGTKVWIHE